MLSLCIGSHGCAPAPAPAPPPAPGGIVLTNLVLWLDAGAVGSYPGTGDVWTDLSPTGLVCNLINGPLYNAGNGGCLLFDGMDTYGRIEDHDVFDFGEGDFTVEAWALIADYASDVYQILAGNHNAGSLQGWYDYALYADNGSDQAFGQSGYISNNVGATPTGAWLHFVVSRQAGVLTFYRNAQAGATGAFLDSLTATTPMLIGALQSGSTFPTFGVDSQYNLNGKIAQVRMYKGKGLTQAEVTQNYNAHLSRYA